MVKIRGTFSGKAGLVEGFNQPKAIPVAGDWRPRRGKLVVGFNRPGLLGQASTVKVWEIPDGDASRLFSVSHR